MVCNGHCKWLKWGKQPCLAYDNAPYNPFDLRKSRPYTEIVMKPDSIRTSLDIPAPLHRKLHEAAVRRGCSARQLILRSIERLVEEELPHPGQTRAITPGPRRRAPDPAGDQ